MVFASCILLILASGSVGPVTATRSNVVNHGTMALVDQHGQVNTLHENRSEQPGFFDGLSAMSRQLGPGGCNDHAYLLNNGVQAEACLNDAKGCVMVMYPKTERDENGKYVFTKELNLLRGKPACCVRQSKYEAFIKSPSDASSLGLCFNDFDKMGIRTRLACSKAPRQIQGESIVEEFDDGNCRWAIQEVTGKSMPMNPEKLKQRDERLQELTQFKKNVYDAYLQNQDAGMINIGLYQGDIVMLGDKKVDKRDIPQQDIETIVVEACEMIRDIQDFENKLYDDTHSTPSKGALGKFMKGQLSVIQTFGSRVVVFGAATAGMNVLTVAAATFSGIYPIVRAINGQLENMRQKEEARKNFLMETVLPWCDQIQCFFNPGSTVSVKYMNYITGEEKASLTCSSCKVQDSILPAELHDAAAHLTKVCAAVAPLTGGAQTRKLQRQANLKCWTKEVFENFAVAAKAFGEAMDQRQPDEDKFSAAQDTARDAANLCRSKC